MLNAKNNDEGFRIYSLPTGGVWRIVQWWGGVSTYD